MAAQGKHSLQTKKKKFGFLNICFLFFLIVFIVALAALVYYGLNKYVIPEREFSKLAEQSSNLSELNAKNEDCIGWVKVDDTRIDYPVMFTPNDPEKYLHLDFEQKSSAAGTPFIGANCDLQSNSIIIYGHNMRAGTMFANLEKFEDKEFAAKHDIQFETLERKKANYQVVAVVRFDLTKNETYKFWNQVGSLDKNEYAEFVETMKSLALYDTDITPAYDTNLLMLSTCSYGTSDERLVVLAAECS